MAASAITQDYYEALGVSQNATLELITGSYRRLALKRHPDRGGSTHAFQLLALAYETLKDVDTRRNYDRIYPFLVRDRTSKPRTRTQTQHSPPASASQSNAGSDESDAARIAALRKKSEASRRRARAERETLKSSIIETQRNIRVLKQKIDALGGIAATRAASNSSETWHPASHCGQQEHKEARERSQGQAIDAKIDEKKRLLDLCEQLLETEKETLHYSKLAGDDFETFMNEREIRDIEARMRERKA
jgi:curved DNA-binding protein CbpA